MALETLLERLEAQVALVVQVVPHSEQVLLELALQAEREEPDVSMVLSVAVEQVALVVVILELQEQSTLDPPHAHVKFEPKSFIVHY